MAHRLTGQMLRSPLMQRLATLSRHSRIHPAQPYTLLSMPINSVIVQSSKRYIHHSPAVCHGAKRKPKPGTGITVHVCNHNGELIKTVEGNEGDDMVDLSWQWDLDIEAACEKSLACSTCHVILEPRIYDMIEEPSDDENDMLDLAFGLTDTSRLGCQIKLTKEMDGMKLRLPSATRNMAVDGYKAQH